MDEAGIHYSQQTDTGTENQTLHVLTHRWVLNNEDTGRGASHTGVCRREIGEGQWGGSWGGITWGEMSNVGEGEKESKAHFHVCTYATVLHALLMYPKT